MTQILLILTNIIITYHNKCSNDTNIIIVIKQFMNFSFQNQTLDRMPIHKFQIIC